MVKRSDAIIHDREGDIFLAVECKSMKVQLSQKSMDQLSVYNQHYRAAYLALTNGLQVYVCKMDYQNKTSVLMDRFPKFLHKG